MTTQQPDRGEEVFEEAIVIGKISFTRKISFTITTEHSDDEQIKEIISRSSEVTLQQGQMMLT